MSDKNVVNAIRIAKALGLKTIALTGRNLGELDKIASVTIKVPASETYRVQEYHLAVYHYLCAKVEAEFFE